MSAVKKLNCGFSMPVLGLGTRDPSDNGKSSAAALAAGLEMGYRHIDTAEMYAAGFSEEIVGDAISGFDRSALFLTSKVWKTHLHYDDVLRAAEGSLKRLKTDYLDLYLIHQVDDTVPIRETMHALNRLVDEKLIRNIGVSNFAIERFEHAQGWADSKVVANQVHYNLKVREAEKSGLLKYCQENDVMLIAWRPLQKGMLLEKVPDCVREIADQTGLSANVVTISMTRNPAHMRENLLASAFELPPDAVEYLRREFPDQQAASSAVALS